MARVFVSHAGEDLAQAREVHHWLIEAGHEAFLDQDLWDGIVVGEQWRHRLHERLRWADAVVCVVTPAYLASTWCTAEVAAAQSWGSRLLPLQAEPEVVHPLLAEVQSTDLTRDRGAARAQLAEALRRVDAAGGAGWPDDRSPFPGLRPFDIDRHRVFFGRAEEVKQLTELLRATAQATAQAAVLLVVGPSGCGKSSLVRAGLAPVMASEPSWRTLPPILPGADPIGALARELATAAQRIDLGWTGQQVRDRLDDRGLTGLAEELLLADPSGPQRRLLIVLDQFEELLTHTAPADRARFTELLRPALPGPVQVVATLRPEFLDALLLDPYLGTLPTYTYTLRPLRREALRAVIEQPSQLAGITLDDDLVTRLVDDTDTGDALPLLAFTLAQLVDGIHRGGRLSMSRYEQLGGVQGALTRQADAALAAAVSAGGRSPEEVIAGLLRLVTVDEQGHPTRWRVNRNDLPDTVLTELDTFVTRRLLTTDTVNGTVVLGVAHEAFLSAWPPLAQAIDANASALRARRAVEHAATSWDDHGRPRERLWSGSQLAAALTDTGARLGARLGARFGAGTTPVPTAPRRGPRMWLPQRHQLLVTEHADLSPQANDFLQASIRRERSRRRRASTVLSVLLILALVGAGFAILLQRAAQEQQRIATARQLVAQADAARDTDPRTALQLGIAAHQLHPGDETRASLVNTLTASRYAGTLTGHREEVSSVAFSPEGTVLATGSHDSTVLLWDLTDPTHPYPYRPALTQHSDKVRSVAFSPGGTTLATASDDGSVLLWNVTDPAHPQPHGEPLGHPDSVRSVAFAPGGGVLAAGVEDGTVLLWDIANPNRPQQLGAPLPGPTEDVGSVAFSSDGTLLATGSDEGSVTLWDVADPHRPRLAGRLPLADDSEAILSIAFFPHGRTLAIGDADALVMVWEVTEPAQPRRLGEPLRAHTDDVRSLAFSSDGATLASASDDTTVILWDIADPARPQARDRRFPHTDWVTSVAFAPSGTLATASRDGTATLWDRTSPAQPPPRGRLVNGHSTQVESVAFAPHRPLAATGSEDHTAVLWDVADPAQPRQLSPALRGHRDGVAAVAFHPDGTILATGGDEGVAVLWDVADPAQPRQLSPPLRGHSDAVLSVAFSPDGKTLATGSNDSTTIVWDITTPAEPVRRGQPLRHSAPEWVASVMFSPDGNTLATGSGDDTIVLWDVADPDRPRAHTQPVRGHGSAVRSVVFSPDGSTLATASDDQTVRVWDITNRDDSQPRGQPLRQHTGLIRSVALSPDGTMLASGSDDSSAVLTDITDLNRPRTLGQPLISAPDEWVMSVAFAPDGRTLAGASTDSTVTLWDLTPLNDLREHAVERACSLTTGGLDPNQWARYISDLPYQDTCPR